MATRIIRSLLILLSLIILLSASYAWWSLSPLSPPTNSTLTIIPGSSLSAIAKQLAAHKIIRSPLTFRLLARMQKLQAAAQAGSYSFKQAATPREILDRLAKGDVEQISLTIPEGFDLKQIAERVEQSGICKAENLLTLAHDPAFIRRLGIKASSLEGYLFPETYRFVPAIGCPDLLQMLVKETARQLASLKSQLKKPSTLNDHQLLTLASIIQKETGKNTEMPLISSVFHNRLNKKIALQTDPTVIYGIANFNGNLTRKDLNRPSPYNTYRNRGLPPGPIASPGFQALLAAAQPAQTDYFYFVARGDGSHQFSKTLAAHNRAVRKYQLHRR